VSAAGDEQDLAELTDRVADEIHIAEQPAAGLVITGDVSAMQGVLVAQVRDELRDGHMPAGPRDDRAGLAVEHLVDQAAHPFLVGIETPGARLPAAELRVLQNLASAAPDRLAGTVRDDG
jgi:hypothetical protein